MKHFIIFSDGSEIEIKGIVGNTQFIQGYNRDVLNIEIPPGNNSLDELKEMFTNSDKIRSIKNRTVDEEGQEVINIMGENYSIYIGCRNEFRDVNPEPGANTPPKSEELNIVTIGQKTYQELELESIREMLANMEK